jgi:hypothetical protein
VEATFIRNANVPILVRDIISCFRANTQLLLEIRFLVLPLPRLLKLIIMVFCYSST